VTAGRNQQFQARPLVPRLQKSDTPRAAFFRNAFGFVRVSYTAAPRSFLSQLAPEFASWLARWHQKYRMGIFYFDVLSGVSHFFFYHDVIQMSPVRASESQRWLAYQLKR
jgi:hypothetical protein